MGLGGLLQGERIATPAAALAWTDRIQVGIGLLPVPLRNVALTAMEIATLARLFPGRLLPGIGHGVQEWMAQVGARVESPLTLLREYTTALRALLAGDRLTTSGRYVALDDVALDWPPHARAACTRGSSGPKSLALFGQLADGTILTGGARRRTPRGKFDHRPARRGRRASAPAAGDHADRGHGPGCVGPGIGRARERFGLDPGDHDAVAGDASSDAALCTLADAGATSVVLQPTADEPDAEIWVGVTGRKVATLLAG